MTLSDWLDTEEFDAVMVAYRTMPPFMQDKVLERFEAVKAAIRAHIDDTDEPTCPRCGSTAWFYVGDRQICAECNR